MNKRQLQILETINIQKKVAVNELVEMFNVSAVTIRKDLDSLENNGLLKREHGYAIINNQDNINYRLAIGYPEKIQIATKALELIEPNETIIIESGSSCALLALEVAKRNQNNTIITNSAFIARYLKEYPLTKIILLGGEYQSSSEAIVGPMLKQLLKNFNVNKLFIGADGIDENYGITGSDYDRSEAVKLLKEHSKELYILSQSHKINNHDSYHIFNLADADYLISDQYLQAQDKAMLEAHNIKVL